MSSLRVYGPTFCSKHVFLELRKLYFMQTALKKRSYTVPTSYKGHSLIITNNNINHNNWRKHSTRSKVRAFPARYKSRKGTGKLYSQFGAGL